LGFYLAIDASWQPLFSHWPCLNPNTPCVASSCARSLSTNAWKMLSMCARIAAASAGRSEPRVWAAAGQLMSATTNVNAASLRRMTSWAA
jgi:hypothetical protein